jgi:NodT family efflux transporter outer membrane factor (OMF) lipoprotein
MRTRFPLAPAALAACAALGACNAGPDFVEPKIATPAAFDAAPARVASGAAAGAAAPTLRKPPPPVDLARWWSALDDAELDSLIARAIDANLDLQIAVARIQESREIEASLFGSSLPAVDASAGAARGTGTNSTRGRVAPPLNAATDTSGLTEITHVAGFDASWELDLFGRLRREAEVLRADTDAALRARDEVLVTLLAEVARGYVEVRSLQQRLRIAAETIDVVQKSVDIARVKLQRGIVNDLDVVLAERQLATVESRIAPLEARLASAERSVAVLLGRYPEELRAELDASAPLPSPPAEIPTGIPGDLLRRRPDLRAAESRLVAANAEIGVATSMLYPQILLTGAVGWQGQGLGRTPVEWTDIGSVGATLHLPLLDFGTFDALASAADFRTQEMLLSYRRAILSAVQEVDDALTDYDAERSRLASLDHAVDAGKRALDLANKRYDRGLADFLNVLDAQRQLFELQDQYALSEGETATQFIAVCKALGGGWEGVAPPPAPPAPQPAIIAATRRALDPAPAAAEPEKPAPPPDARRP